MTCFIVSMKMYYFELNKKKDITNLYKLFLIQILISKILRGLKESLKYNIILIDIEKAILQVVH